MTWVALYSNRKRSRLQKGDTAYGDPSMNPESNLRRACWNLATTPLVRIFTRAKWTAEGRLPRTTHLALLAGLVLILGVGVLQADADGPDFYAVNGVPQDDVLNIRAEPDPHARKIGEIPPDGTCIRNLGCRGGLTFREFTELSPAEQERRQRENPRWCKVEYGGVTGWVAGRYLTEGDCRR